MVERYAPPSVLVTAEYNVMHLSESVGRYLIHSGGEVTSNLLRLAREELRTELRAALHSARAEGRASRSRPIPLKIHGAEHLVVLSVRAVPVDGQSFFLVIFDEIHAPVGEQEAGAADLGAYHRRVADVEAELAVSDGRLQAIIEEYEGSQEEMRASHEELQSANEELRSTLEELETSKEELQSMNEELQTVNQENRHKVEELAQLSSDLQNLLAATDIATLFLDRQLRILRFTPQVGEIFNVRPVDRGRPISDLTHRLGYDELQSDAELVLRKLVPIEREVKDEHGCWYLTRVLPYRSTTDRIEGVVITFIEITSRKAAEEGLRRAKEAAELASQAKSQFLAMISHELRTPLTGVLGFADLLETEVLGPMSEEQQSALARIQACSWHLVTIIDEILSFSRLEAGKEFLREDDVDLAGLLTEVCEVLKPLTAERGLTLSVDVPTSGTIVRTDSGKVRQILLNLTGNAVRYTERGEVRLSVDPTDRDWMLVHVQDTGRGIAVEDQERIFEPFIQVDNSHTRSSGGTGLGLAICRRLAGLLHARLTLKSSVGEGTTFTLWLPR